jgi:hypothetical protein
MLKDKAELWENAIRTMNAKIEKRKMANKKIDSLTKRVENGKYLLSDSRFHLSKMEKYQPTFSEAIMDRVNGKHMIGPKRTRMNTYPYPDRLPIFFRDNGLLSDLEGVDDSEYTKIVNDFSSNK